jgi:diadenosine tetraphosphate (Ap4A) HIT family hydrolase
MMEIEITEKAMNEVYTPIQTNIAIFGNKTPWLHAHIIARRQNDATFPKTAFEINPINYKESHKNEEILKIKNAIIRYL